MADIEAAFAALEQLDEKGREALAICTLQLREQLAEARGRTAKAEYLLDRLVEWSSNWGLSFDLGPARAHWDAGHPPESAVASDWLAEHVAAQAKALSRLRVRLACAAASEKAAVQRAEAAEARLQEFVVKTEG